MTTLMKVPLFSLGVGETFLVDGRAYTVECKTDGLVTAEGASGSVVVPSGMVVEVER